MTEKQQQDDLKRYLGHRVIDQARLVIDGWQSLEDIHWNALWHQEYQQYCHKLFQLSKRHGLEHFSESAHLILQAMEQTEPDKAPSSDLIEQISQQVSVLADSSARANDAAQGMKSIGGRKPIYVCFPDASQADSITQQLIFFGIPAKAVMDWATLDKLMYYRIPAAFVMDINFDGDGINVMARLDQRLQQTTPIVFFSEEEPTFEQRLAAVRTHCIQFQSGQLDMNTLVRRLSDSYALRARKPFRVLIVEDDKAYLFDIARALNSAGMLTQHMSHSNHLLEAIAAFEPDVILMDLYLPNCSGIELAQVIRQQPRYDTIPIIYLSSEQDMNKQMYAMSQGGDDFLTKPVPKEFLIATVRNRGLRYRRFKDRMIRDSLTGLLNHNNILELLNSGIKQAQDQQKSLCFVMLDIDHFKSVNDTYGHAVGDQVINSLALYLMQSCRQSDGIGRYGGEEFALVLNGTGIEDAQKLVDAIRSGFQDIQHETDQGLMQATFSAGVAVLSKEHADANAISQAADAALYEAKRQGRNRVCIKT